MSPRVVGLLVTMLLGASLAGCFGDEPVADGEEAPHWPSIFDRADQPFITDDTHGYILGESGPYGMLETEHPLNATHVFVEVDLPVSEGGDAPNGIMSLAYWRPNVPEGVQVPVTLEIGPYFREPSVGTEDVDVPGTWLMSSMLEQMLPHGFAIAQASVFGTGSSNHCMDLMGEAEQLGIKGVVDWLGTQDWSNGKVAMIGKSYDGSTPWEAATFPDNPYLATIVPISGLIGVKELMWRNASSEARVPIMHNGVYGSYPIDGETEDSVNCPDYVAGLGHGSSAYVFGDELLDGYWAERYFLPRVLEHDQGSVYLIQGLHDWNVDPHMAIPTINTLQDAGIDAKGLFGQWDHDYPDRPDVMLDRSGPGRGGEAYPGMVRMDWMQDLLEWFTFYLKGEGPQPGLWIEVNDNTGRWRLEEHHPPTLASAPLTTWVLGSDLQLVSGDLTILPDATDAAVFESAPLEATTLIAGTPWFHVEFQAATYGGQLYALLEDCDDDGACIHIGHAIMDLRYPNGDGQQRAWVPLVSTTTAELEFFAMDVVVEAGHTITLSIMSRGEDYLPASTSTSVFLQEGAGSTLSFQTFDPATRAYFEPPTCTHEDCLANA